MSDRARLYLEDLPAGTRQAYGDVMVDREEAIAFARRFDPQPFHLDDAAAAANPLFGRLSASGWFTAALGMRMTVDYWQSVGIEPLAGAGLEETSWLLPVFPGDRLRCEGEVLEARVSRSRPEVGLLKTRLVIYNQHDQAVMRQVSNVVMPRRP